MAKKKAAAKKVAPPKKSAAKKTAAAKEEKPAVYRLDMGESLPPQEPWPPTKK